MKFGVREICDVVLRAKANQKVGNKIFYKDEPVIYFDTLKTSSMEGAATTVYAQGGRGNARLMAWEGERTITFTMEDALISPVGFSILSGAGLTDASESSIKVHKTEQIKLVAEGTDKNYDSSTYAITLGDKPYQNDGERLIYVMVLDDNGEVISEPYLYKASATDSNIIIPLVEADGYSGTKYVGEEPEFIEAGKVVLVDYYVEYKSGAQQIEITPDKFGGNYYLEASTLFRDTNGVDMPAEFIIPNCKIQSNFTFTMASSGDPSTFTFTMDAFPDYTRFDKTKKVLAAIQIIADTSSDSELVRASTRSLHTYDESTGRVVNKNSENGSMGKDESGNPTYIIIDGKKYMIGDEIKEESGSTTAGE